MIIIVLGFKNTEAQIMVIGLITRLLKVITYEYLKSSSLRQQKKIRIVTHEKSWICNANIENFFNSINHEYLLKNLFLSNISFIFVKSWLKNRILEKQTFNHV